MCVTASDLAVIVIDWFFHFLFLYPSYFYFFVWTFAIFLVVRLPLLLAVFLEKYLELGLLLVMRVQEEIIINQYLRFFFLFVVEQGQADDEKEEDEDRKSKKIYRSCLYIFLFLLEADVYLLIGCPMHTHMRVL